MYSNYECGNVDILTPILIKFVDFYNLITDCILGFSNKMKVNN